MRRSLVRLALPSVAILLLCGSGLLPAVLGGSPTGTASSPAPSLRAPPSAASAPSGATTSPATIAASAVPAATSDPSDSYVCRAINATICVSVEAAQPQIVPSLGNSTASIRPGANQSITLWVKSKYMLNTILPPSPVGENATTPIRINITGILWNGDPWNTPYDGSVWHANPTAAYWSFPTPNPGGNNATYKYWYRVTISNSTTNGFPNFFPGEYVTWWIYIVHKDTTGLVHRLSPVFHYWVAGAWAYSPYPGAEQYGGPNASSLDLSVSQTPAIPNWNDTVKVTIATTNPDDSVGASICNARLLVTAVLPSSVPLPNATIQYPQVRTGSFCAARLTAKIPAFYAQVSGTIVSYSVIAFDSASTKYPPDQIITQIFSYVVGANGNGNGSFISGNFNDDININATPAGALTPVASGVPSPLFGPGTYVNVTVTSANPGTALQSAQIDYTFYLPSIGERATGVLFLSRINSTTLTGTMPGVPIGGYLNFSVLVWDYPGDLEISSLYGYGVAPLSSTVPGNLGFLWVYVFDNRSQTWVNNASVIITSSQGFVAIPTRTSFGVAYPNASGQAFVPLLLVANQTYQIAVSVGAITVSVPITLHDPITTTGTIYQDSSDTVVAAGNPTGGALFFWFNTTAPGTTYSGGSPILPQLIGPIVGLALAFGAVAIILPWWRQIAARRKEQERRVTL